jgi:transposase
VSEHLATVTRLVWLEQKWPRLLRAAKRRRGVILFADAASFAPWGSWRSTWARRGQQPEVPTSGKRKGDKVCGAMAYFSGRLFSQGSEGRCNAARSQAFFHRILAHTTPHLFLIHAGARSHTSASPQAFWVVQSDRMTAEPLPSYAPDDHPIAYLWQKTKKQATHNKSFKEFATLTVSVEKALAYFATPPDTVLGLFGRYCEESGLELQQAA